MADRMSVERAREIISAHKESLNAFGRQYCRCSECDMAEGFIKGHSQQSDEVKRLVGIGKRIILNACVLKSDEKGAYQFIITDDHIDSLKEALKPFVEKDKSGE